MRYRVKPDSHLLIVVACAGMRFTKTAWTDVPAERVQEAASNPYLEAAAQIEPEPAPIEPIITGPGPVPGPVRRKKA